MPKKVKRKLALVLSGGGARGAYEAGVLHYVRTMLPAPTCHSPFEILCGTSVGAVHTCYFAATAHRPETQGEDLRKVWETIQENEIYERNFKVLLSFFTRGGKEVFQNLFRNPKDRTSHFPGFFNTAPFAAFIEREISWRNVHRNIESGIVKALSVVASNVFTGRMQLFIEKNPCVDYIGQSSAHFTTIKPIHALASASIPVIFPPTMIDGIAYVDGGLRLNTPLAPAIQLGADSIFVIGLNHRAGPGEEPPFHGERGVPPSLGQVLGRVMNALFLDKIQYDLEQVERINKIIEWSEMLYGRDYLDSLNRMLARKKIVGDISERGLRKVKVFRIRPSQDVGEIFAECYEKEGSKHFSTVEKFLIRCLDLDPDAGVDFLSYLTFLPGYIRKLLELGFEDARRQRDQIEEFLVETACM